MAGRIPTVPPYEYQPEIEWVDTGRVDEETGLRIWIARVPCQPKGEPSPAEYATLCPESAHGQPPCQVKFVALEQPEQEWELIDGGNPGQGILPLYRLKVPVVRKGRDATHVAYVMCMPLNLFAQIGFSYYAGVAPIGLALGLKRVDSCVFEPIDTEPIITEPDPLFVAQERYWSEDLVCSLLLYERDVEIAESIVRLWRVRVVPETVGVGALDRSYSGGEGALLRLSASMSMDLSELYVSYGFIYSGGGRSALYCEIWRRDESESWYLYKTRSAPLGDYEWISVTVDRNGNFGSWRDTSPEVVELDETPNFVYDDDNTCSTSYAAGVEIVHTLHTYDAHAGAFEAASDIIAAMVNTTAGFSELKFDASVFESYSNRATWNSHYTLCSESSAVQKTFERVYHRRYVGNTEAAIGEYRTYTLNGIGMGEEWDGYNRVYDQSLDFYQICSGDQAGSGELNDDRDVIERTGSETMHFSRCHVAVSKEYDEGIATYSQKITKDAGEGWWLGYG